LKKKPPENSFHPKTRAEWRVWLEENHEKEEGVWLISFLKITGKKRVEYDESVEEALCFGWIDSRPQKLDAERTMLYFSPRKPKSGWSRLNKVRIEKLIAEGLMHPSGQAKIDAAIADGSWTKLDAVEDLTIPEDLLKALQEYPDALANFEAFPKSARRGILEWIAQAKKADTREKRVNETARLAQDNVRANQWKPKA